MINPIYQKLAQLVVNYSLNIKKGEKVIINSSTIAEELIRAIYVEVLKAGAHPRLVLGIEGIRELFFEYASEEQLLYLDNADYLVYKEVDCHIGINADYNTKRMSLIDPKKIANMTLDEKSDEGYIVKKVEQVMPDKPEIQRVMPHEWESIFERVTELVKQDIIAKRPKTCSAVSEIASIRPQSRQKIF